MSELNSSPALKRSFGMREAVTITAVLSSAWDFLLSAPTSWA